MPDATLGKIMTATDPADVATLAMIEAMRQIADNGKATNRVLEGMQGELRDVRERVIRIEATEVKAELNAVRAETERLRNEDISRIDHRVTALELDKAGRAGAKGFADAVLKYGPFLIAVVTALFIILVATKRIVL